MQTTHPPVFTQLFAVSCAFGYQRGPFLHPWLKHSFCCVHTRASIPTNPNVSIADLCSYFPQWQDSYYKSHQRC